VHVWVVVLQVPLPLQSVALEHWKGWQARRLAAWYPTDCTHSCRMPTNSAVCLAIFSAIWVPASQTNRRVGSGCQRFWMDMRLLGKDLTEWLSSCRGGVNFWNWWRMSHLTAASFLPPDRQEQVRSHVRLPGLAMPPAGREGGMRGGGGG